MDTIPFDSTAHSAPITDNFGLPVEYYQTQDEVDRWESEGGLFV